MDVGRKSSMRSAASLSRTFRRTSDRIRTPAAVVAVVRVVVATPLRAPATPPRGVVFVAKEVDDDDEDDNDDDSVRARKTFPRANPVWTRAHRAGSVILFFFLNFFFLVADDADSGDADADVDANPEASGSSLSCCSNSNSASRSCCCRCDSSFCFPIHRNLS